MRDGKLSEAHFTHLRLRNGLYMQRHAHMLRVAIPYGVLSGAQLRKLARIARVYDRGYGHFTTRQNIQFNWPELDDTPRILHELAEVEMHAIQTSGNCIRNITCDHLAGVAADESVDPRPWSELIRQWSTLNPEFNWLPRKFKIAVSGARTDRAALRLHDIGLQLHLDARGQVRFAVYVGGGMGRTPVIGKPAARALAADELLGYLHAVLRVYNQYGRRDHKYRSRIKILVNDLGIDVFCEKVAREWRNIQSSGRAPQLTESAIARAQEFFAPRNLEARNHENDAQSRGASSATIAPADARFVAWRRRNVDAHRLAHLRIVHVSLKAPGRAPGDITDEQMAQLADIAEQFSGDEIRATHEQNLVLPNVHCDDLGAVWRKLDACKLATPNIGTLTDMICCPGLDFCSLANAATIPIANEINAHLTQLDRLYDIGEVQLKMSGCMNACGHHHVGHIGVLGVDKKGSEWYQLTLGGSAGNDARLGALLGPAVPRARVAEVIEMIIDVYLELRRDGETFLQAVTRLGVAPFKQRVYRQSDRRSDRQSDQQGDQQGDQPLDQHDQPANQSRADAHHQTPQNRQRCVA